MSSANFNTFLDMSSSKSLYIYIYIYNDLEDDISRKVLKFAVDTSIQTDKIYIKNSIVLNTDLCGAPLKIDFQFEISPSTITLCLLAVRHFFIQLITSLHIIGAFSLSNNI